jgi:hypothetical protein
MSQIRESQIIPSRELEQNPYVSPPRDLALNTVQSNGQTPSKANTSVPIDTTPRGEDISQVVNPGGIDYGIGHNDAVQPPSTPHIISVKQQIVNMHDDGTVTIDLILVLEDIVGCTEYDIRVGKDAGNL